MNESVLLVLVAAGFMAAILLAFRYLSYKRSMEKQLRKLQEKLAEIRETDSGEKVMAFTDDRELMGLLEEINGLLERCQRMQADYRRAEMASKKMLSNISHDIKTPLTVILGYLEIMRLDMGSGQTERQLQAERIEKAEQKARQLMDLVNEFFTLAKLEAGDTSVEMVRLDVSEVCRESILSFYELLDTRGIEVEISIPEMPVFIMGDREAVWRILFNLITNALRYGSDGNYLGLCLRTEGPWVWIDVTDRGKGIEKEFADRVFERLYTMEDSRSRSVQGNGLGLTIAKNLALSMGGELTLESLPGIRTTFTVRLKRWNY